jgi:hypothetical protein
MGRNKIGDRPDAAAAGHRIHFEVAAQLKGPERKCKYEIRFCFNIIAQTNLHVVP